MTVAPAARWGVRRLASGLGFTESPVWTPEGRLMIASVNRGMVYEVFLDARPARKIGEPGGGPNGLAPVADGLLVCQNGGTAMPSRSLARPAPSIQHLTLGGDVTALVTQGLSAPSDGVIGPDGHLWFTDPADHFLDGSAQVGAVRRLDLVSTSLTTITRDLLFPNGLGFSPDGQTLYVAESATRRVRRYRDDGDGWNRTPWADAALPGIPDGLAVDAEGHVWVACSFSGIVVRLNPAGEVVLMIDLEDEVPTALSFVGEGLSELVVTSARGGSVLALPAVVPGAPPHPAR